MNINKFMTTMAKAGVLYIGAFAIWKLGIWHGEGAGVALGYATEHIMCAEGGALGYLEYVEKNERNLFGRMFTMGAKEIEKQLKNIENN